MENSLRAEAKLIRLSIELFSDGVMDIILEDDGCGMSPELAAAADSPFTTTRNRARTTRRPRTLNPTDTPSPTSVSAVSA